MFAKRLFPNDKSVSSPSKGSKTVTNLDLQVVLHYGIPYTASILAFDPIQRLLAIGTLDGRIKIIGGDNIEGLLISPKKLPYKNLEFLHNRGLLVGVSNENDIQVWDLECRRLAYSLQWETNITAFAVIHGTYLMYTGDENGLMSVMRYDSDEGKLLRLQYSLPAKAIIGSAGLSCPSHQSIVGILPQPSSSGTRVLIAYENGLIILWDVSEGHVVTVRGYTELQLKDEGSVHQSEGGNELRGNAVDHEQEDKEICSLCWVSNSGSILAVGYINGDILLWDISSDFSKKQQAGSSSKPVVKLQLASGSRRLPVIVLNWSANAKANDNGGQLLIYGGDDMGSEEVLTVLNLEWSSGIDSLRCISRVDLNLNGSFADMMLIPSAGATEHNSTAALFVLTNPGQLNVYDGAMLPVLKSDEGKLHVQAEKFPVVVPTIDPYITVTKICLLPPGRDSSKDLLKKAGDKQNATTPPLSAGTRWPVTGGVPSESFLSKDNEVQRIYISGYQDGSVRIWNATCPLLTLMFLLEGKILCTEVDDQSGSVSSLDFCPTSMSLAVGNECGQVRVYMLQGRTNESSFHLVSENKHEVNVVQHGEGYHCIAAFIFSNSSIQTLRYAHGGEKLAVGFETGQVAMLDMSSLSIMFRTDCLSGAHSPIMSIAFHDNPQISVGTTSTENHNAGNPDESAGVMLVLTKDANVFIIDSVTGKMISAQRIHPKKESAAISMHVIDEDNSVLEMTSETFPQHLSNEKSSHSDSQQRDDLNGSKPEEVDQHHSSDVPHSNELLSDPLLLICCEDSLCLAPLKSAKQGNSNSIQRLNLEKHCCWSTTFKKRDEKGCGLILLYQTGDLEMRSLPALEVLAENSIMSILRWSFKTNMDKAMSSYDNGQITMVNGSELAFISLLDCENDFRIPDSLPCLHDNVVAAAADAAISLSMNQKKRQATTPGILGGIFKGLKGGRADNDADVSSSIDLSSFVKLEDIFSKDPFVDPLATPADDKEVELNIDDIVIDDVLPVSSSSSIVNKHKERNENTEREKLFQGATNDVKPRVRTTQEIMTQYRFGGDAAAAAAHAKDKLFERQEKLERLSRNTAELQDGAQNFAELANELVRNMEKKKWWNI